MKLKGNGSQVLWSPVVRNKVDDSASVELISADMTGHIIHWDITIGNPLVVLQDGNKPVLGKLVGCSVVSSYFCLRA